MEGIVAVLFSGGKDSTLALHKAFGQGLKPNLLITLNSENDYSFMFHKVNIDFTKLQAEALGIRQMLVPTKGEKEQELEDLERAIEESKASTLITGALASEYQKSRIERICSKLSVKHVAPLWHMDPRDELAEIARDYYAIVTQVSAEGLDESFLGSRIDENMISRLEKAKTQYGIHLAFEGGEAESFVLDAPLFRKMIEIKKARRSWDGKTGQYIIEEAVLKEK
ncbi:MAG: diphthine--ammonia ligase [Candidatus Micrarchaeia archaeon]